MAEQLFEIEARGLDFLGFVFYHTHIRLRKRIKRNIFRALSRLSKMRLSARQIRLAVGSYLGWLKYTDSRNLAYTLNRYSYGKIF